MDLKYYLDSVRNRVFPTYEKTHNFTPDLNEDPDKEDINQLIKLYVGLDRKTRDIISNPDVIEKFLSMIILRPKKPQSIE